MVAGLNLKQSKYVPLQKRPVNPGLDEPIGLQMGLWCPTKELPDKAGLV